MGWAYAGVMREWEAVGVVTEGEPIVIGGLNPWDFKWRAVRTEPLDLPHPSYPHQSHSVTVYEITNGDQRVRFAAGELSPNVYGFYVLATR